VAAAGQAPDPLQLAADVAIPFEQEALLHATSAPTSPTHAVVVTPSHAPALHAFVPVAARHGGRLPFGAPRTALHLPIAPGRLHAEHWSVHAESQQTPSAQWPEAQSASFVHIWSSAETHCPVALHDRVPVHESGSAAFVTAVHTPGVAGRLHAWQVLQEVVSQHVPSTQFPVSQSAAVVQVPPRK
jgi:hypothetical protein